MYKLIDTILLLSGITIAAVIGIIIYLQTPETFSNFGSWTLPKGPDKKVGIIISNDNAYEDLLAKGEGLSIVKRHCTGCHSEKLIIQNRMSRERWADNITWMQETQGLGDLGANEPIVLDYLAKYYAPKETGRRKSLEIAEIEWYILDMEE